MDCLNTIGSFECSCMDGFTGWSSLSGCSDIDECKLGNNSIFSTVKPLITNTSEEFIKCRLDNFSMSFILY